MYLKSTFRYGCIITLVSLLWYTIDYIVSISDVPWRNATRNTSTLCSSIPKVHHATTIDPSSTDDGNTVDDNEDDKQDSSSLLCQMIDSKAAFPYVWERNIKPHIRKVSLMEESDWNYNLRSKPNFVQWVQEVMQYFTLDKLQHTQMSLPLHQQSTIHHIHTILERKLQHRQNTSIPPLRILIFGGSVTTGHECLENIFDFYVRKDGKDNGRKGSVDSEVKVCAWPGRLQEMFNVLLGKNIVEITNMATGGAQTEMSTTVLQFGLLPNNIIPDIIIWDHGINDAIVPVTGTTKTTTTTTTTTGRIKTSDIVTDAIFQKLQAFYQASIRLSKNDECQHSTTSTTTTSTKPPVIILLDTLLGHIEKFPYITDSLTASAAVSKMISWYPNIWGISYANTIRSYVLSHLVQRRESLPLLGMKGLYTHPGMMYHITLAWTMTYNIMSALHNNCILQNVQSEEEERLQSNAARTSESTSSSTKTKPSVYLPNFYEFDVSQIPELTDELHMMDIPNQWNERISESTARNNVTSEKCFQQPNALYKGQQQPQQHSSLRCYYAWVANRVLRIESPREIYDVITANMVQNKGWTSFHEDSKTSPGWVVKKGRNSYFEMLFDEIPITVESLTIIYMQSYSEKWYNSTLQIDCTFEEYYDIDVEDDDKDSIRKTRQQQATSSNSQRNEIDTTNSTKTTSTIRHMVSGYHKEETSILVPMQLPLPATSTTIIHSEDDSNRSHVPQEHKRRRRLRLQFQLINGEAFKIAGIALC